MIKLLNVLRKKDGFTLVEVAVSTAAMAGLMSIFALLPQYTIGLSNVEVRQKANSIIQEVKSQVEDHNNNATSPGFSLNTTSGQVTHTLVGNVTKTINDVRPDNITYKVEVESYYIDALDNVALPLGDEGGERNHRVNGAVVNTGNIGKVRITVSWNGYEPGSVDQEITIRNSAVFPAP